MLFLMIFLLNYVIHSFPLLNQIKFIVKSDLSMCKSLLQSSKTLCILRDFLEITINDLVLLHEIFQSFSLNIST